MGDSNVFAVMHMLESRAERGLLKYGVTTERDDLTFDQWCQHLQEELLDAAVYLQKLRGQTNALQRHEQAIAAASDPGKIKHAPGYTWQRYGDGWFAAVKFIKDFGKGEGDG